MTGSIIDKLNPDAIIQPTLILDPISASWNGRTEAGNEGMLPWSLLEAFVSQYPEAVEERFQRGGVDDLVQLVKLLQKARYCMRLARDTR